MLKKALSLAARGLRVFPCVPNSKLPTITEWSQKATTDEAQIREWWSGECVVITKAGNELTLSADCNIGVSPGLDLYIVDVDCKNGDMSGLHSLQLLQDQGLPPTLTFGTPSGGLHLYYNNTERESIKSIAGWRPGIDIRGDVGQGVGCGSIIDGREYTLEMDVPLSDAPPEIYRTLPFRNGTTAPASKVISPAEALMSGYEPSQYDEIPAVIPAGGRDGTVFGFACSWRTRGYPIDHARALMETLWSRCEQPPTDPFTLDEAMAKLERAYAEYEPSARSTANWASLVTPDHQIVEAPAAQVKDLKFMLENFIFIENGSYVVDLTKHQSKCSLALSDFKNSNKNLYYWTEKGPKGGAPKKIQLVNEWLEHDDRQTCYDTGFHPLGDRIFKDKGVPLFNVYSGSELGVPEILDMEKVNPFLDHLNYMLPNDNDMEQFLNWAAFTVQRPDIRIPWCPLLISEEGVGKGFLFELLELVVGSHNAQLITAHELSVNNQFNEFMYRSTLVLIDDLQARDHKVINALKPLITTHEMTINLKYGAKAKENVWANFIIFSNYVDAMKLSADDRRYWVIHIKSLRRSDAYYRSLFKWRDKTDAPSHVELFLKTLDVSKWDYAARPAMTAAKKRMINSSRTSIEEIIYDAVEGEYDLFAADIVTMKLVKQYVKSELDIDRDLSRDDESEIKTILNNLSERLPDALQHFRVPRALCNKDIQIRPWVVRNADKWLNATREEISIEYLRAEKLRTKRQGVSSD